MPTCLDTENTCLGSAFLTRWNHGWNLVGYWSGDECRRHDEMYQQEEGNDLSKRIRKPRFFGTQKYREIYSKSFRNLAKYLSEWHISHFTSSFTWLKVLQNVSNHAVCEHLMSRTLQMETYRKLISEPTNSTIKGEHYEGAAEMALLWPKNLEISPLDSRVTKQQTSISKVTHTQSSHYIWSKRWFPSKQKASCNALVLVFSSNNPLFPLCHFWNKSQGQETWYLWFSSLANGRKRGFPGSTAEW